MYSMHTEAIFPSSRRDASGLAVSRFLWLWWLALLALILNLGHVLNLGNVNAFEKLLFLAAALAFLRHRPVQAAAACGVVLMLFAVVFSGLMTDFAELSWARIGMALAAQFAVGLFFLAKPDERETSLLLRSIAWAPLLVMGYSVLMYLAFGLPLMARDFTGALRLSGATSSAFLAASCYASVVAASFLFAREQRVAYLVMAGLSLLLCALSGTRTPTACALASMVLIVLSSLRSASARIGLVVLGTLLSGVFLATAGEQILIRFISGSMSGREKTWSVLMNWIDSYPVFGIGFGHHGLVIPDHISRMTNSAAAHNEYLRLLVELGYAGSAVFLLGLLLLFLSGLPWQSRRASVLGCLLFLIFFVYAATDNALYLSYALFVPLSICLAAASLQADPSRLPVTLIRGRQ
jgi:hypothetical protein